jgi:hypothetical protein
MMRLLVAQGLPGLWVAGMGYESLIKHYRKSRVESMIWIIVSF